MNPSLSDVIGEWIDRSRRILLVTHVSPDGDAIGSLLGLAWLLREAKGDKDLTLAVEDPVPENYRFLPGSRDIVRQVSGSYDLVIALDCSDRHRMGNVYSAGPAALPLINIDHHVTNTHFGTINWVDPLHTATSQMILDLAEALGWNVTAPAAECLLTGLVTDTRSFRTSNVDTASVRAALRLMEAGASLPVIAHRALDRRSLASVRLWSQAIDRSQLEDGILWTWVTRAMRRQWGLSEGDSSGLTNFLSGVQEARIVAVFTERDNEAVDVGLRAVPGLDVAQAALKLGGGGHPQAAGCTLHGEPAVVENLVLTELRRCLQEQEAAGG